MSAEILYMAGNEDGGRYSGMERRTRRTEADEERFKLSVLRVSVAEGVEAGIKRTFATLGISLEDPDDLAEWHADRKFIRDQRLREEERNRAGIVGSVAFRNGIITVLFSALLAWGAAKLGIAK